MAHLDVRVRTSLTLEHLGVMYMCGLVIYQQVETSDGTYGLFSHGERVKTIVTTCEILRTHLPGWQHVANWTF